MTRNLDLIEEIDYREKITTPFLGYVMGTLAERKKVAGEILTRKPEDLLLVDGTGFNIDSIFSGLNEENVEYIVKRAPLEYKESLAEILGDKEMMDGVWEIAKSMDDDEGDGQTRNQDRIKKIIQYIQDNQIAFQNQK